MSHFERPDTRLIVRERLSRNAEDIDALFVLAVLRVQDGRVDEGITILDHVLRIDPAYPGGWRFKAKLHRMQGQTDASRSADRQAEVIDP